MTCGWTSISEFEIADVSMGLSCRHWVCWRMSVWYSFLNLNIFVLGVKASYTLMAHVMNTWQSIIQYWLPISVPISLVVESYHARFTPISSLNSLVFRLSACGNMMTSSNWNISALLALCEGNSSVTDEFPSQRPVTWNFDVFFCFCLFFYLRLNKRLSKQSTCWRFETQSRPYLN